MLCVLRVSNEEVLMKRIATMLIALSLVWLAESVEARTWYVKSDGSGDAPTIQAGINAAGTGDIVLLAAGTYTGVGNRDIDFLGKAITVTSESGRDVTIIDCEGLGRGFLFRGGETSASVLSGVIIRNGTALYQAGAGIYCDHSSPTISNNTIGGNSAYSGGGIYCYISSPTISNNTISSNSANTSGGGIYCDFNSSPAIANNTISGNSAYCGGGIYCYFNSSPAIANNTISANSTQDRGGGIYCYMSSPTISNNTISSNSGGGIYSDYYSIATISNNTISGNSGGSGIVCVSCGSSMLTISGNTISGNSAPAGGGIYCYSSTLTISNSTISGNSAPAGGGIYCDCYSIATISNSTISDNSAPAGGGIYCYYSSPSVKNTIISFSSQGSSLYCTGTSSPTLTCCDVYGNAGGDWAACIAGQAGINGNFSGDPLFCARESGDFRLNCTSPCVNRYGCGQIGAFGVGCGPTAVQNTTWGRIKSMFR
jgi:parallel beta-helix repeat protein